MDNRAENWNGNSFWRWLHPTEHQEKPILCRWTIPRPNDRVTRVNRALTKRSGSRASLCRPRPPLRLRVMARGNRQATRTRIHISPPKPTETGDRRQQILSYWTYPRFISPTKQQMNDQYEKLSEGDYPGSQGQGFWFKAGFWCVVCETPWENGTPTTKPK